MKELYERYTLAVLADLKKNPHNVGAKEVKELVQLAHDAQLFRSALFAIQFRDVSKKRAQEIAGEALEEK